MEEGREGGGGGARTVEVKAEGGSGRGRQQGLAQACPVQVSLPSKNIDTQNEKRVKTASLYIKRAYVGLF